MTTDKEKTDLLVQVICAIDVCDYNMTLKWDNCIVNRYGPDSKSDFTVELKSYDEIIQFIETYLCNSSKNFEDLTDGEKRLVKLSMKEYDYISWIDRLNMRKLYKDYYINISYDSKLEMHYDYIICNKLESVDMEEFLYHEVADFIYERNEALGTLMMYGLTDLESDELLFKTVKELNTTIYRACSHIIKKLNEGGNTNES